MVSIHWLLVYQINSVSAAKEQGNQGWTHLSARSMVTSDQMLSAMPRQSNPGPMLALVAGTLTTTRLRSIAASLGPDRSTMAGSGQGLTRVTLGEAKTHGNGEG